MQSKNKGFSTEHRHYETLCGIFGNNNVSAPRGTVGGSDFIVFHDGEIAKFESKTNIKDQFDSGVLSVCANGYIFNASAFLTNTQISQLEGTIKNHIDRFQHYAKLANTDIIPHPIEKERYEAIRDQGGLINIQTYKPLENIIETSFVQSQNKFVKANYVIINNHIYCISSKPELDPLKLLEVGAGVLDDSCINYYAIRIGRTGSRMGMCSANIRVLFRLKNQLPATKVKLTENYHEV